MIRSGIPMTFRRWGGGAGGGGCAVYGNGTRRAKRIPRGPPKFRDNRRGAGAVRRQWNGVATDAGRTVKSSDAIIVVGRIGRGR